MATSSYDTSKIKEKYHDKTLSQDAVTINWQRILDTSELTADYVWLNIPIFDLSQLGLSVLFSTLPYEWQPFAVDFTYNLPSVDEIMQGIWVDFSQINYEFNYPWTASLDEFIRNMFKPEYWKYFTNIASRVARYGISTYEGYLYDPPLSRMFTTQTFHRLRLQRKPDFSFMQSADILADKMEINEIVSYEVLARLRLLVSAQENAFVLGLGVLGKSRLGVKSG